MSRFLALAAASPLLLAGCGASADEATATITDSAGVRIVTSPATEHPLPMSFTELRRIGGADSGAAAFSDASPSLVRTDGLDRIFVLDRDRSMIAVFDSTGVPLTTFGRDGGGPGEFGMAFALFDSGADEVAVFDFSKQALVRWASSGELLPETRLPTGLSWTTLIRRGDTTYMALDDADSLRTIHKVVMATPRDTVVLDSMVAAPRRMVMFDCFGAQLAPMFAPTFTVAMAGDLLAMARQDQYQVDLYRRGRLTARLRRPVEPVASTTEDAKRMYPDGWKVKFGNGGGCTIDGAEVAEKSGMADRLPVLAQLGFGPDSTIWVRRHSFPDDPEVTDVFDAAGAYLGTVTGRGLPLGWLGRDRILFPVEDPATGVTTIGIFMITREGGEGAGPT